MTRRTKENEWGQKDQKEIEKWLKAERISNTRY